MKSEPHNLIINYDNEQRLKIEYASAEDAYETLKVLHDILLDHPDQKFHTFTTGRQLINLKGWRQIFVEKVQK